MVVTGNKMDKIYFTINGDKIGISGSEVTPDTSLNDYIRNYLNLHGTKAMCHEGGCGACTVSVSQTHPITGEKHVFAVNSCLVHVLSCHEWDITTVEGVGNRKDGYHPIQKRLAAFNGTQCGYCTPGWVMNMFSLYESSQKRITMQQVENSFGGNMCRCTGYRPILDAFKSFATDSDQRLKNKVQDMEDLDKIKCLNKCEKKCSGDEDWCLVENKNEALLQVRMKVNRWYKAYTVQDVFKVLSREGTDSYRLIAGNTGKGVFPITSDARVLIDISSISGLKESYKGANLVIGAGMTLTDVMGACRHWVEDDNFKYLQHFRDHLDLVAHVAVRNIGTIGGNLAMKAMHRGFPSDVFLLLGTVEAVVTIVNSKLEKSVVKMQDFLNVDLTDKLISDVKLPPLSENNHIRTYKIMPRAQNAHAILNAGFLIRLSSNTITKCNLVFGGISPAFIRASRTEEALKGLDLEDALKKGVSVLKEELAPVKIQPEPSPECRRNIALGVFYKTILSIAPAATVNPRYASGGKPLSRPISHGTQTFDTDKSLWPLNEPVPKLEALTQCSGEARYACDVNTSPREVHVAFVLSSICVGEIERIDPSDALKLPGVVTFLSAKDIPGKNTFTPKDVPWQESEEEILASSKVSYYGQPVGLIAASTHKLALKAAGLVKVQYKGLKTPVLSIEDALKAPDKDKRVREDISIKPTNKGVDTTQVIKGSFSIPSQYHYTMETQCCSVTNTERGLVVRASTQWMDLVQVAVSQALNMQENQVEVQVPRVGGAYGGKASRSAMFACACALVARTLNRTATLVTPLTDNMAIVGKRQPCRADYEIGINDEGVIQYVDLQYYSECGYSFNDSSGGEIAGSLTNLYGTSRWRIVGHSVLTDKHSNTWCRAPATTEGIAILEHIMHRIAHATKKDPTDIRIQHLLPKHETVKDLLLSFKTDIKYNERKAEIEKYNSQNAWKKRAIATSVMSYPIGYSWNFPVTVSVYHADGTVEVSHGGIEMGQGINTKVAQVCAYALKVSLDKVSVRGSDSFSSANAMASNGSITSECVAFAAVTACGQLLRRLEPARTELNEPTWEEVVKRAYNKGVNLQASAMTSDNDSLVGYSVYGACAAELELDVLTGNHVIARVDLIEDTGVSLSPEIDVGQIEGAFIMGLGLWTSEHLIHDTSGRLLTDRTWTYKPPGVRDIPADFRVSFKRNSVNNAGVLRSKATGEPALTLAVAVPHALRDAVAAARTEYGYKDAWVNVGEFTILPATGEPALTLAVAVPHALRDAVAAARTEYGYKDAWVNVGEFTILPATGEPALTLAVAVPHALRDAVAAARTEYGYKDAWVNVGEFTILPATGEPALTLAVAVPHALRDAVAAARTEYGYKDAWVNVGEFTILPATGEPALTLAVAVPHALRDAVAAARTEYGYKDAWVNVGEFTILPATGEPALTLAVAVPHALRDAVAAARTEYGYKDAWVNVGEFTILPATGEPALTLAVAVPHALRDAVAAARTEYGYKDAWVNVGEFTILPATGEPALTLAVAVPHALRDAVAAARTEYGYKDAWVNVGEFTILPATGEPALTLAVAVPHALRDAVAAARTEYGYKDAWVNVGEFTILPATGEPALTLAVAVPHALRDAVAAARTEYGYKDAWVNVGEFTILPATGEPALTLAVAVPHALRDAVAAARTEYGYKDAWVNVGEFTILPATGEPALTLAVAVPHALRDAVAAARTEYGYKDAWVNVGEFTILPATGEPALTLAVAVPHALRDAVAAARTEYGYKDAWVNVGEFTILPATGEPALTLAVAVPHALRDAVAAARTEYGYKDAWVNVGEFTILPATGEPALTLAVAVPHALRDAVAAARTEYGYKDAWVNVGEFTILPATGEPALTLAVAVPHALRDAVAAARTEYGYKDAWVNVDTPLNLENILKAISPKPEFFKLK